MKPNSKLRKFLSLILRHKPEVVGLALDPQVWVSIDVLIAKCRKAGSRFALEELLHVVEANEKKRFTVSEDGKRIRAARVTRSPWISAWRRSSHRPRSTMGPQRTPWMLFSRRG